MPPTNAPDPKGTRRIDSATNVRCAAVARSDIAHTARASGAAPQPTHRLHSERLPSERDSASSSRPAQTALPSRCVLSANQDTPDGLAGCKKRSAGRCRAASHDAPRQAPRFELFEAYGELPSLHVVPQIEKMSPLGRVRLSQNPRTQNLSQNHAVPEPKSAFIDVLDGRRTTTPPCEGEDRSRRKSATRRIRGGRPGVY